MENRWGNSGNCQTLFFWVPKLLQMIIAAMKLKDDEEIGEDAMEILYPGVEEFNSLYNEFAYRNLKPEMLDYINTLWETLKIA